MNQFDGRYWPDLCKHLRCAACNHGRFKVQTSHLPACLKVHQIHQELINQNLDARQQRGNRAPANDFHGELHQFFQHLASFSQNSINTNKVEIGDSTLEIKHSTISLKLAAKFINKMVEHIGNNLVPKEIPAFAKNLYNEQTAKCIALGIPNTKSKNSQVPNLPH
jgi:hypothetical protein